MDVHKINSGHATIVGGRAQMISGRAKHCIRLYQNIVFGCTKTLYSAVPKPVNNQVKKNSQWAWNMSKSYVGVEYVKIVCGRAKTQLHATKNAKCVCAIRTFNALFAYKRANRFDNYIV